LNATVGKVPVAYGIRPNLLQFFLLSLLTFFVGLTVGLERNILPVIATEVFHVASSTLILSFIMSFGFVKAILNMFAGKWSDEWGRRKVLVIGWVIAIPVPIIIIWAPKWDWIVLANILLGANQALAWTTTVTAKVDLSGPQQRGLALGINEFSGYAGVATGGLVTGYLAAAFDLRVTPFLFGLATIVFALLLTLTTIRETRNFALAERSRMPTEQNSNFGFTYVFAQTTWRDKAMFAASQAGFFEKFTDTLVWAFFPIYFFSKGLNVVEIGVIVGVYAYTWSILQIATGYIADRVGRKWLIVSGMWTCSVGVYLTLVVSGFIQWVLTSALIGLGMSMLYPNLLAVVSDVADPGWRAASLGVYRLWRDLGYGVGALLIGVVADSFGFTSGFHVTSWVMLISGFLVAITMYETLHTREAGLDSRGLR